MRFTAYLVLFIGTPLLLRAQEVELKMPGRQLINFNQAVFTIGGGVQLETGSGLGAIDASWPDEDDESTPETVWGGSVTLGLYAPNGMIDFSLRGIYSAGALKVTSFDNTDDLDYQRLEVPLHLRVKLSRDVTNPLSVVLIAGPVYARYIESASNLRAAFSPFIEQYVSVQGGIAVESQLYESYVSRLGLELLYSYPLQNTVKSSYLASLPGSVTSEEASLAFISLGFHVYFGK